MKETDDGIKSGLLSLTVGV